ncbi:MAG TPA: chemotaxis protein CheC [Gemmatimonadales bacterium]|nr:chemotaxis protein CheC [Gemmatimonadales bacterium]
MAAIHESLQRLQLDALREVANIASGHAATALGQLTERRIMITVPEFEAVAIDEIPTVLGYSGEPVVVVAMHLLGDLTGSLVFLMPEINARRLCTLLLGQPFGPGATLDKLAQSTVTETGNILGGAYSSALGTILSGVVMLSVPTFGIEPPDQVLAKHRAAGEADDIGLCIETRLTMDGDDAAFGGHLVMLPNQGSLRSLLDALRV